MIMVQAHDYALVRSLLRRQFMVRKNDDDFRSVPMATITEDSLEHIRHKPRTPGETTIDLFPCKLAAERNLMDPGVSHKPPHTHLHTFTRR